MCCREHRRRKETYINELEREVARLRQVCTKITKERDSLGEQNASLLRRLAVNKVQWHSSASTPGLKRSQVRRGSNVTSTASTATGSASLSQSITPHSSFESTMTRYSQNEETRPLRRGLDYDGKSTNRPLVALYLLSVLSIKLYGSTLFPRTTFSR